MNDFAFRTLGIESFHVCNAASNVASRRVKQKTGAEFVGYIELAHHNGQTRAGKMARDAEKLAAAGFVAEQSNPAGLVAGLLSRSPRAFILREA